MQLADIASVGQIGEALATIGTFAYGFFEWRRYRENMREQNALAMYARLLELAIEEPLLSRPDIFMSEKLFQKEEDRYTAYSTLVFATCEQLFLTRGSDKTWKATIRALLIPHLLAAEKFGNSPQLDQFDQEFMTFINQQCRDRLPTADLPRRLGS
jgi:hypothetical protein